MRGVAGGGRPSRVDGILTGPCPSIAYVMCSIFYKGKINEEDRNVVLREVAAGITARTTASVMSFVNRMCLVDVSCVKG